jgi:beta-phosphoglucomutase-like phosphatase (HAD superfamily)
MLPAALLLDLDGTLVDSEAVHAESIDRCFRARGLLLSAEERDFVVGHAWQEIFAHLRVEARLGISLRALQDEAIALKERELRAGTLQMPVMPGGAALVVNMHEREVPVAIVSGSCRAEIEQVLPRLGVAERLSFYLGAEDYPRGKPAPDGYLLAARRLGVAPDRCLVVEDSHAGIASARAAGMRVIATRGANPPPGAPGHQDQGAAHRIVGGLDAIDLRLIADLMEDK